MSTQTIISHTLCLLLFLCMVACQKKETAQSSSSPSSGGETDLGHGYVRRDGVIHFIGGGTTGTGADATRIDMPSPELLRKVVASKYGSFQTAEGLDVASFEALSEEYTRDKNRVYIKVISSGEFLVVVMPEADPKSFEVLASKVARDKNHVWYYDRIQHGIDPSTLELVDQDRVFKDKNSVYYQGNKIIGADPASFRHLGSAYYADRSRAYWCTDPVQNADPETFEVLGDSFIARDKSRAYRSGELLTDCDVDSLELILHDESGFQIFSDKKGIHVNNMTFPRSKAGKVEVIDNSTIKAGDFIHLIESSRFTPSTLFKENGKLIAETPAYEPMKGQVNGMITAEVTDDGLKNIRIIPLPGSSDVPSVPKWQMEVFTHGHSAERMIELGKQIK